MPFECMRRELFIVLIGLSNKCPFRTDGNADDIGIGCHGAEFTVGILLANGIGVIQLLFV